MSEATTAGAATPAGPAGRRFCADISPEEFAARRGRIFEAIGPGAMAVLVGAGPVRGYELFRQSNQFYYCCGVASPGAYLLLDGTRRAARLYLPHRPPRPREPVDGPLAAEDAERIIARTGIEGVYGVEALAGHLREASVLYTPHRPAEGAAQCRDVLVHAAAQVASDPWDGRPGREEHFIALLRRRLPGVEIRDLSPILDSLRAVKSPAELALLRRAGALSALAVTEAMRATAPGVNEGRLGALAEYIFRLHGARGSGYRAIIAGGVENTWDAHYFHNDCPLGDGELVLMDAAPDYRYYTSDIGRMWPVGGTYSPVQRELYGFIVEYHKAVLARIRPGRTAEEIHQDAAGAMRGVLEGWRFSKDIYRAAAERTLEFRGHLSHPVGMAVHDSGGYRDGPLKVGTVLTVDPQMWVPQERRYIRVEDTVAVTEGGIENFTAAAPLELDDVERLMAEQARPLPLT